LVCSYRGDTVGDSWVTLQLPYSEENISETVLEQNLISILPELEVFVPVLRYRDRRGEYTYSLFDGYVFVRGPYEDGDYLRLTSSPYVHKVLTYKSGKNLTVAYTPDLQIQELRDKLSAMVPSGFEKGDRVSIMEGIYRDLNGTVMGMDGNDALVEIYMPLGSLTKLTTIPCIFLKLDEGDE